MSFYFRFFRWSLVLPKLKRHLNAKNTWSDHDSIHAHRNLNYTERSAIARHQNFNAPKICKITVVSIGLLYPNILLVLELVSSQDVQSRSLQMQLKPGGVKFLKRSQRDGACAHYVMVSKFQWKPFWLATQRDPENDWTATQNRVN